MQNIKQPNKNQAQQTQIPGQLPQHIERHINKKWVLTTALIIAIVLFFLVLSITFSEYIKIKNGVSEIKVEEITNNDAYIDVSNEQQYITEDIGTVFVMQGWYKNNPFDIVYVEDNKLIMKISKEMNPNDGVIEGYIVEKIENNKPYAMVFVDEDFKNNVNNVKIYWGASFEHSVDFDFSKEVSPGIYMNQIEDDASRFENDFALHYGGVMVGDLNEIESTAIKAS